MGKLTISMAIFNSYVTNYQRVKTMVNKEIEQTPIHHHCGYNLSLDMFSWIC